MPKKIHHRREADPEKGREKYAHATFADPVNNKYPIDTPGRIKAAWAYIHQSDNSGKYSDEEVRTIKRRIRRAAEARKLELPDPGRVRGADGAGAKAAVGSGFDAKLITVMDLAWAPSE